jgi:hypothetical protein
MKVTGKAVQVKVGAGALTQLKARFATWRALRKLGMRIPPELWSAAVEMVAVHGACRVAGELNLDYRRSRRGGACGTGSAVSRKSEIELNVVLSLPFDFVVWASLVWLTP